MAGVGGVADRRWPGPGGVVGAGGAPAPLFDGRLRLSGATGGMDGEPDNGMVPPDLRGVADGVHSDWLAIIFSKQFVDFGARFIYARQFTRQMFYGYIRPCSIACRQDRGASIPVNGHGITASSVRAIAIASSAIVRRALSSKALQPNIG